MQGQALSLQVRLRAQALTLFFCLCAAAGFLLLCTRSSPLYPMNDWNDANAFFTVGKAMAHGQVIYRDIFEQKGPYLYLLHAGAYLMFHTSFTGVFFFEVLALWITLFFAHKTMALFAPRGIALVFVPVLALAIVTAASFSKGDSAEEFCLPLLMVSLWAQMRHFKYRAGQPMNVGLVALVGAFAGIVLLTKYSMLGYFFGWAVVMFFDLFLAGKRREAFLFCAWFLGGMMAAALPWAFYFAAKGGLYDFIHAYFIVNLTTYGSKSGMLQRFLFVSVTMFFQSALNILPSLLSALGLGVFAVTKRMLQSAWGRMAPIICFAFLAVGVYGGERGYGYYHLIFTPFAVLGLSVLALSFPVYLKRVPAVALAVMLLTAFLPLSYVLSPNAFLMHIPREALVQYRFARVMNRRSTSPTLLNYGSLDNGFYTAANIVPNVRFFEKQNIDEERFPLNMQEQRRYVRETKTEFVVVKARESTAWNELDIDWLYENYTLIDEAPQGYGKTRERFLLFQDRRFARS